MHDGPTQIPGGKAPARRRPVLLHPAEDSFYRLLSDPDLRTEADQVLRDLRRRKSRGSPVFLVMGSHVGGLLRRRVGDALPFLAAHHLDLTDPEVRSETTKWLAEGRKLSEPEALSRALDLLGGDLRLLQLLRTMLRRGSGTPYDPSALIALLETREVGQLLQVELEGLEPAAVQLLIVAACATTSFPFHKVPAGVVASETVLSTVRRGRTGKALLHAGERVDGAVATRLSSDLEARRRTFRAEGFSVTGYTVSSEAVRSLALVLGDAQRVEALEKTLAARGVAELAGPVVRTLPPFGPLIRGAVEAGASPAAVYRQLTGQTSPLAALPLWELSRLKAEVIQGIEPDRSPEQARMLARLGEVWLALRNHRSFPTRTLCLALSALTDSEVDLLPIQGEAGESPEHSSSMAGAYDGRIFLSLRPRATRAPTEHSLLLIPPGTDASTDDLEQVRHRLQGARDGARAEGALFLLLRPYLGGPAEPKGWLELNDSEIQAAAYHEDPPRAFWATVRAKAGSADLNPFKVGSALPPGSPMFFGRETEQDLILSRIREECFLVVGGRQVGKTSLKNRILFELQKHSDLEILELDGQDGSNRAHLVHRLRDHLPAAEREASLGIEDLLARLVDEAHDAGRLPIIVFNEIDNLVVHDPEFFWHLRRLHETGRARFLLIGYLHHAAKACNDPSSALYRWTSGPGGASYLTLAELSESAARDLLNVLEQPPLALAWESGEQKQDSLRLILGRTYRIPLLIQAVCKRLVQRVLDRRRYFLRYDDVLAVLEEGGLSALANIGTYDPEKILPELPPDVADDFIDLALAVAAKHTYFEGPEALIHDPDLLERDARLTTFSANDVHDWLLETLPKVLFPKEVEVARRKLEEIHMRELLFALTLTPILSLIPPGEEFFFQLHLYPREVSLQLEAGETIEDRILKRLLSFARSLSGQLKLQNGSHDPTLQEDE